MSAMEGDRARVNGIRNQEKVKKISRGIKTKRIKVRQRKDPERGKT